MFDLDTLLSLLTLTGLEIVLGIDNIVVIAIIAATLPVDQRDKARVIGLALAMITRLLLLFTIAWIAGLTAPWIELFGATLSGRDLLMLGGGLFLIVKAVNRLRAQPPPPPNTKDCPYCLTAIPLGATRCSACTSEVPVPAG